MTFLTAHPILPAKDFRLSLSFYSELGFSVFHHSNVISQLQMQGCSFILQDRFEQNWAENSIMYVMVGNLVEWWQHLSILKLPDRYPIQPLNKPVLEPWGQVVLYMRDPSNVCWHFAEAGRSRKAIHVSSEESADVTNLRLVHSALS